MKDLKRWMLQMDNYFTITQTRNKQQWLACVALCTESEALEWWKVNRHRYVTCEEVKDAIRDYYGDHYKPDRAFNKIRDLKQTGIVQKYLNYIDGLNVSAKMTDHYLINIILNGITPRYRQAMAHYEDVCSELCKWKQRLLHVGIITTEFEKKEQDNRSKRQGKKRGLDK